MTDWKTSKELFDETEKLKNDLSEIKAAFSRFACQVTVIAISGLADAAVISNQKMNEFHSLVAVQQLADYARKLRTEEK